MVAVGYAEQLFQPRLRALVNRVESFRAVAYLHHTHADAGQTQHLLARLLQHGHGQHGRPRAEVKNSLRHRFIPLIKAVNREP